METRGRIHDIAEKNTRQATLNRFNCLNVVDSKRRPYNRIMLQEWPDIYSE